MHSDTSITTAVPGDALPAPLPRVAWIIAGALALTVTGAASALAWRGETMARRPVADANATAPVPTCLRTPIAAVALPGV